VETKKVPFFVKLKRAIFNFDDYHTFAMEKVKSAVFYFILLMLIFSLVISAAAIYKVYDRVKVISSEAKNTLPDFKFENNELVMEQKDKILFEDEDGFLEIVVESREKELEYSSEKYGIIFLKDKVVLNYSVTGNLGATPSMLYQDISSKVYDLNNVTKDIMLDYLNSNKMIAVYIELFVIMLISNFIGYSIAIFFDVIILAALGFLVSRIFKINLKFTPILSMAFYAMTLPVILLMLYMSANIITGFEIEYFRMGYERNSIYLHHYSNIND
jgi:hypothetical protein